jgi:hypothetical protein
MIGVEIWVCDFVHRYGESRRPVVVGSREGEDFLVEGCSQSYRVLSAVVRGDI